VVGFIDAVIECFFAEGGVALGELEVALGGLFFVGLFAEVQGDFMGVHFLGAGFFVGADFGAGGKIGQALEGEELGGGVVAGADGFHGFEDDGVVDIFGGELLGASVTGGDGVELRDGEFLAGGKMGVYFFDGFAAFPEDFERAVGDEVESEAAFGTGFVDAGADVRVGAGVEHLGEVVELGVGEGGEGGLATMFSLACHKTVVEKGGIKGLRRKWREKLTQRHKGGEGLETTNGHEWTRILRRGEQTAKYRGLVNAVMGVAEGWVLAVGDAVGRYEAEKR
jgi:hypothetical protein